MPLLPRRLRRPRAELRIELNKETPPDLSPGGVAHLQVRLLPLEPFRVRRGRLDLVLLTTRFARTALDGYHEYTTAKLYRISPLCEELEAAPASPRLYFAALPLPCISRREQRPVRRVWQAKARFEIEGFRELQAALVLLDVSPSQDRPPVVDGSGFLPLYEIGADKNC